MSVGTVFAALYAAHMVADHWVQTQRQACGKGRPGWPGRRACAAHVATYTVTALVALLVVAWRTGAGLSPVATAAGLAVSALTHYLVDRRAPLRAMATRLGKDPGWLEGGGGLYLLDQSWHVGWLLISALVITGVAR
jgi:hypothetical protein